MRKFLFLAMASALVTLFACSGSGKKISLQPNLKPGEKYSLEYKVVMDQDMKSLNNRITILMGHLLDVKSVSPQKESDLELKYNHISIAMKSGNMIDMSYDSDSSYPAKSAMDMPGGMSDMLRDIYGKVFGSMLNKPMLVKLEANGKVKSVSGYKELLQSIKDSMQQYLGPGGSAGMDGLMSDKQISDVFQQLFAGLPQKPVSVGESWTADFEMENNGIGMKVSNTYKLVEVLEKENVAVIDVKGKISSAGNKKINNDGLEMTMELTGTSEGRIEVDMTTGMTRSGKVTQDMNVTVESKQTGKMPMTMKTVTTINGKKS